MIGWSGNRHLGQPNFLRAYCSRFRAQSFCVLLWVSCTGSAQQPHQPQRSLAMHQHLSGAVHTHIWQATLLLALTSGIGTEVLDVGCHQVIDAVQRLCVMPAPPSTGVQQRQQVV